jgi:hypothetical protein
MDFSEEARVLGIGPRPFGVEKGRFYWVLVGAVGIESIIYLETKEFCGAARPSNSSKETAGILSAPLLPLRL